MPKRPRPVILGSALFLVALALTVLFPYLAFAAHRVLPTWASNFLFFFPQLAFGYSRLAQTEVRNAYVLPRGFGAVVSALQWALLAAGFGFATARMKLSFRIPLALIVIVGSTVAIHWLLGLFGLAVELDGP